MNAILQKERRSLRGSFLATIAATILCALIFNGSDAWGVVTMAYAVGAVLMAASIFGNEFHSRTMLLLLSQPAPRRQLWLDKMRELALELFVSFIVLILNLIFLVRGEGRIGAHSGLGALVVLFLIPLVAFCSAPAASLICKNVLGAMAFTIVVPYGLVLVLMLIDWSLSTLVGHERLFLDLLSEKHLVVFWFLIGIAVLGYCISVYRMGYRAFLELQLIDSQSQELSLPGFMERPLARYFGWLTPGYSRPLVSLFRKELRLQRPAFVLMAIGIVVQLVATAAWVLHRSELFLVMVATVAVLCLLGMPVLTGLVSVSEERNMGVIAWQLTQPVSPHKQWFVKMLVAFSTSVLLGVIFPGVVLLGGHQVVFGPPQPGEMAFNLLYGNGFELLFWSLLYIVVFSLVVFGSTISTNVSRGIAAALGMLIACAAAMTPGYYAVSNLIGPWLQWCSNTVREYGIGHGISFYSLVYDVSGIATYVGVVLIVFGLVWLNGLSFANFRSDELPARRIRNQIVSIALYVLLSSLAIDILIEIVNNLQKY
ncbi:MAG TPA: hypothetical protein VFB72_17135 [Verrucomicrobiae bacterium]|nr:hypothetical protein [Verrucomicrobiae bacterium]